MVGLRSAVGLLLTLFVAGCTSGQATPRPVPASTTTTTALPTTTATTPSFAPLTVQGIVDGRTIALSDGTKVQIDGLAAPGECWAAAAVAFAKSMLVDKPVRINRAAGAVSPVELSDGTNYALLVLGQGVARAEPAANALMLEAQSAAQQALLGLWGPPCNGVDAKPVTTTPPPTTTTTTPTNPVFYRSCDEAERAGVAPIRRGEPGYRIDLDKNRNGIACE